MIGDETLIDVSWDMWISSPPLFWWPTFVYMEVYDHLRVCDLLRSDGRGWKIQDVTCLFESQLVDQILVVLIPAHCSRT